MITRPVQELARLLPPGFRGKVLRRALRIEPEAVDGIVFKVARSRKELEAAFRLTHDEYVRTWRTVPEPSGLRTDVRYALPTTATIIGLEGEKVVGALTLVGDSPFGVPMEVAFTDEIADLRNRRRSFVEMESIATVEMPARRRRSVMLYLVKAAVLYAKYRLSANDLVAAVRPRQRSLFREVLMFDDIGHGRRELHHEGCLPAIGMRLCLDNVVSCWRWAYGYSPERRNMARFFYATDKAIELPPIDEIRGMWSEELFGYFFDFRTNPLEDRSASILKLYREHHLGEESEPNFRSEGGFEPQRRATQASAVKKHSRQPQVN